jgi:uncharacterized RDD family membrane protein YckC
MPRFDEVELEAVTFDVPAAAADEDGYSPAPLIRRALALLIDLSLFGALAVALSPLLPPAPSTLSLAALGGFVLVVSFYYFVGSWMLWGRTIGGAIFDVRIAGDAVPAVALRNAVARWAALFLSMALGGLGFLLALLPSRRSLADRLSATHALRAD